MRKPHIFDEINEWSRLTDSEIEENYSDKSLQILEECFCLLADTPAVDVRQMDSKKFVNSVREMRKLYETGSRGLGQAIIAASAYLDSGDYERAESVYVNFLGNCPSKFYRDIAKHQLSEIRKSKT